MKKVVLEQEKADQAKQSGEKGKEEGGKRNKEYDDDKWENHTNPVQRYRLHTRSTKRFPCLVVALSPRCLITPALECQKRATVKSESVQEMGKTS